MRKWLASSTMELRRLAAEPALQPRFGHLEVARNGVDVHLQCVGDLLVREAAKVQELDDPRLALIEFGECHERSIEREQLDRPSVVADTIVELDRPLASAALRSVAFARVIDQHLPHRTRRDGVELNAIVPLGVRAADQPDVRFGDEVGRAQRVPGPLAVQVSRGDPMELAMSKSTRGSASRSSMPATSPPHARASKKRSTS
jgi:hypothetical protein